ncbi:hypothetical protein BpHYR1_030994 [Brachionus plicatilis]|uniref:Uncharacterized protein n=1 Tax=Brachionus plicatilis TaxID=10195 RepID=A0A3M7T6Z3_BRAPC|nr:hypothetical protein BpHYR1_030994 [Brachionus plicatilis]
MSFDFLANGDGISMKKKLLLLESKLIIELICSNTISFKPSLKITPLSFIANISLSYNLPSSISIQK